MLMAGKVVEVSSARCVNDVLAWSRVVERNGLHSCWLLAEGGAFETNMMHNMLWTAPFCSSIQHQLYTAYST